MSRDIVTRYGGYISSLDVVGEGKGEGEGGERVASGGVAGPRDGAGGAFLFSLGVLVITTVTGGGGGKLSSSLSEAIVLLIL